MAIKGQKKKHRIQITRIPEIARKEVKGMIRFLLSRRRLPFIIGTLVYALMCFNFPAYGEESLICADEIEKYCKETKPGGGRILNCLKEHENDLSASCREKMSELHSFIKGCEQACSGDIGQFCKEVQPGEGRIIKCLREREKDLSASCRAKLEIIDKKFQRRGE